MKDGNENSVLSTSGLSIGYGSGKARKTILQDLNLTLYPGQLVALLGQNGVGKSTLLKTLAGLLPPLEGQVIIKDKLISEISPSEKARILSLVLTEKINPGNLDVFELISLGRYPYTSWTGNLNLIDKEKVKWAIDMTRVNFLTTRKIYQLSDGQLQKVMITRALAQDGDIIFLDEPTAHLDLNNRVEIMTLLKHLAEETGKAVLVSTHDLEITLQTAHELWLSNFGKPVISGTPEDLVLNGSLSDTFYKEGFDWDIKLGKFRISKDYKGEISVEGNEVEKFWTSQALGRMGIEVKDNLHSPSIKIRNETKQIVWELLIEQDSFQFNSIKKLLAKVNSLF